MSNLTKPTTRIDRIDYAKTLCIFLMVVGHWTWNDTLYNYIYSFHMPAFFIISGVLFKPRYWLYTLISFLIPICCIATIMGACQYLFLDLDTTNVTWLQILTGIIHYRFDTRYYFFSGDWFIWSLVALRFLFGDISFLSFMRKKTVYIPLTVITIIYMLAEPYMINSDSDYFKYTIQRTIPSLPFFCIGLYLRDIKWNPNSISPYIYALFMAIAILLPLITGRNDIFFNEYGGTYLLFFINAATTTLLMFYIFNFFPANNTVKAISTGTMIIIGTNQTLIRMLYLWLPFSCRYAIPFLVIAICYIPIVFFDKHLPLMLGKWRR